VETIARIRRAFFGHGKPICRKLGVSRKVVRKVIRSGATEFRYQREDQPLPKIGCWRDTLEVFVLAVFGKNVECAFPDAALGPSGEAGVDAFPFAIAPAGHASARQSATPTGHYEETIVLGGAAGIARLAREQAFDPPPLCLGQFVPLDHVSCSESSDPEHKESSP